MLTRSHPLLGSMLRRCCHGEGSGVGLVVAVIQRAAWRKRYVRAPGLESIEEKMWKGKRRGMVERDERARCRG